MVHLSNRFLTGTAIPAGSFFRFGADGPEKVSTNDLFQNKKVVLFAFPAAFTGTCNLQQNSFNAKVDEFKKKGVDGVYAVSANDVFVQKAYQEWSKADKLQFLQDFNVEFSKSINQTLDLSAKGLGARTNRYSLYAENGVVKQFFAEEVASQLTVTDADTMLKAIN
eukprot:CAMPEP_0202685886 /NCGR_PEP_ID=MMETSP1385-20130828/1715_1 /ASSEMBLY_ACC=CAM_ASM_000861 /TAXON_ID=933848 /ORGANISM="Elphidium margaritaceum" /LENGTH=165 /DNA_ID=CAMNT_0049340357 /DNA_START=65 /DNA_END=562 /DNA_ORIENTATION=-